MSFETAIEQAITDLHRPDAPAQDVVIRAFELILAAWPDLAEHEPDRGWDLFALHVLAAIEALHLGLGDATSHITPAGAGHDIGPVVIRLVEALADRLDDAT